MTARESFANYRGYLTCLKKLAKFASKEKVDINQLDGLNGFLLGMQKNLLRIFNELQASQRFLYTKLPGIDQNLTKFLIEKNGNAGISEILAFLSKPQVTVIVTVYNSEKFINNCLDSICNQSLSDIQIICVDDGSTDKSGLICDQYAKTDERVMAIHIDHMGTSKARNIGLDNAAGEYVSFVDSSDWIHPNFLETLFRMCMDNDCAIAQCGVLEATENDDGNLQK